MDISWDDVRLFLAIAEGGSLSAAARRLRVAQPTVTRRLRELEHALGAALFRRSVEGVTLTDEGARLLEPARRMAEWAGELSRVAERPDQGPTGRVRVAATPYLAAELLAPLAGWLAEAHPGLLLEVSASVAYAELGRGEADLALRARPASSPELETVASITHGVAVFAAPALAARLGPRPKLTEIPWVAWCAPYDAVPPNPQLQEAIPGFVPSFSADDYLVLLAAAEAGAGAIALGDLRHRFSRPRSLVPLEVDLGPHSRATLHLVCPRSALAIPRVRKVAWILEELMLEARPWAAAAR